MATDPQQAVVWFDGASKGNPGPAGAGAIVTMGDKRMVLRKRLGRATNNEAEWHALYLGLQQAAAWGAKGVTVRGDSQLVIRQFEGRYRVKAANLQQVFRACRGMIKSFPEGIDTVWIPREENGEADAAANEAVDAPADVA